MTSNWGSLLAIHSLRASSLIGAKSLSANVKDRRCPLRGTAIACINIPSRWKIPFCHHIKPPSDSFVFPISIPLMSGVSHWRTVALGPGPQAPTADSDLQCLCTSEGRTCSPPGMTSGREVQIGNKNNIQGLRIIDVIKVKYLWFQIYIIQIDNLHWKRNGFGRYILVVTWQRT